jgi:hypothetical protein
MTVAYVNFRTTETQQLGPAFTYILKIPNCEVAVLENHRHKPNFNNFI